MHDTAFLRHPSESASMSKTVTDSILTADDTSAPAADRPRRSVGRVIGIAAFSVVAGLIVIALIVAGTIVWTIQRSFPQL